MTRQKLRILIVEDIPADAELVMHELNKAGILFVAERVETRDAYISALQEFKPDIILSDYALPSFDGMTALRLVQKIAPEIPFILTTGAQNEETAVACMKAGATDYILKDHIARIAPAVNAALEMKRVTDEKNDAERKLRESMMLYRTLFESANDAIFLVQEGHFVKCNPSALSMFGCAEGDILQKRPEDVSPPRQPDGAVSSKKLSGLIDAALHRGPQFFEWNYLRSDKTPFVAEVSLVKVDTGAEPLTQMIIRDITERKRAERTRLEDMEEIRTSREHYAHLQRTCRTFGKRNGPSSHARFTTNWVSNLPDSRWTLSGFASGSPVPARLLWKN